MLILLLLLLLQSQPQSDTGGIDGVRGMSQESCLCSTADGWSRAIAVPRPGGLVLSAAGVAEL